MKMKRILSLFLSVLMVVCLVPVSSIVADDVSGDTVTNGYYNEKLEWVPGGTGVFTYQDGLLELRKTAKPTADPDIFEITLGVTVTGYETMAVEDNAAAVVVIDTSNSMNSTIKAEKAAAIDFVNSFAGSGTATRYVALVTFDQKASASNMGSRYSTTYWVDVSTRTGLQKAVSAINSISVGMNGDGGTNLDAGLQKATEMLGNKMLSGILDGNKFAVVMTDGIPTYYNSSWGVSGSGSGGSQTINNAAAKSATALRKLATVYTICFGVAKDKCYGGGPTVGNFLRDSIATAGTTENKYAYDTYTTTELAAAYQSISDSIQMIVYHDSTGCGLTISDPMGSSVEVYEAPETFHDQGAHYAWVLDEVAPKIREEGNITYYTYEYEITYKIKLKSGEEGFDETAWHPANAKTFITWSDGTMYDFPVPGVRSKVPTCTVTYNCGEHGILAGQDDNGNVVIDGIKKWSTTPECPAVLADDGYFFHGWEPEVAPKVTGDVTYTAQYTKKIPVTITGNSDKVEYNGEVQTAEGYVPNGLPKDAVISGLVYTPASGKDAGEYTGEFSGEIKIMLDGKDVTEQYGFTFIPGTLTITKRVGVVVTVTEHSDSYKYDGHKHSVEGYDISINDPLYTKNDFLFEGTAYVEGTTVGNYDMPVLASDFTNLNNNFENVTFMIVNGKLAITPIDTPITIIANSAGKVYDGTPLTDPGYTYTQHILQDGDVLTAVVEGSQTNAGMAINRVTSYKVMRGGVDVTENYTFAPCVDGELEVARRQVSLVSDTKTKIYDGTPLTAKNVTVKNFVEGEGVTYEVTGTITNAGFTNNSFTYQLNANTLAINYDITYEAGVLTVTPLTGVVVTITEHNGSFTYDGTEKTVTGYDYAFSSSLYKSTDFSFTGNDTVKGIYAGEYDMPLKTSDFTNLNGNFTGVFFKIIDGKMKIDPISTPITITADSNEKTYDGTPLTDAGYTYTQGVLMSGDVLSAVVEGSRTGAGETANKVISYKVMRGETDVTGCYTFGDCVDGTLKVNPRKVTLTSAGGEKVYDGTYLIKDTVTVTGEGFALTDGVVYEYLGKQLNVGTSKNTFRYTAKAGTNLNNYEIDVVYGDLTVTELEGIVVTITENSGEYVYDGTEKKVTGFTWSFSDPLYTRSDFTFNGSDSVSGITKGTYEMKLKPEDFTNVGENFKDVTFIIVDGALVIKPIDAPITITADSNDKIYDGTELTDSGYTYTEGILLDGDVLTAVVEGSQTNAGSSANVVTSYKVMRGELDVTDSYTFAKSVDGTLTVNKRPVTVTSKDASGTYNGNPLTKHEVDVTGSGFVEGEGLNYSFTGSQTNAGSSENTFTYTAKEGTDLNNYNITKKNGTLTVSQLSGVIVTVTEHSGTYTYDGTTKKVTGYDVKYSTSLYTANDFTFTGADSVSGLVAGTYPMELSSSDFANKPDNNFTGVTFVIVDGSLVINPITAKTITVTADSNSKTYDGTALTDSGYTFTKNVLVDGDGLSAVVEGSQTSAGESANVVTSYKVMRGETDVTHCYTFKTSVDGKLTVNKRSVKLTSSDGRKTYDSTPLVNTEVKVGGSGFVAGEGVDFTVTGKQTDAGSSENSFTYAAKEGTDLNNYDITPIYGTLTVDPLEGVTVTITEHSGEYTYDGTEKTVTGYDAVSDNDLYALSNIQFGSFAGVSGLVAGTYEMELLPADFTNLNPNFKDVVFVIEDGALVINPITDKKIKITANSNSKTYDSTALTDDGYTFTEGVLVSIDELSAVVEGSQTNAGESANVVTSYKIMHGSVDVTGCYTFEQSVDGKLTVSKRNVMLTSADDMKVYDGEPLTKHSVQVSGDGFVSGEGVEYSFTGTQTNKGSSQNLFTYDAKEGTDLNNYAITPVYGTLTVYPLGTIIVKVAGNIGEETYDGTEKEAGGYTVVEINNPLFTEADISFNGPESVKGLVVGRYPLGLKSSQFSCNNDNFENVVFLVTDGALVIRPITAKTITVTAASGEKTYDGTGLTNPGYTFTEGVLVDGDELTAVVSGSQTNAGTGTNTVTSYKVMRGELDVTNCYTFTGSKEGILTVNPRKVKLTSASASKMYDGQPLTAGTVTPDGFVEGEGVTCTVTGTITNAGSTKNSFTYSFNEGTLADNYEVEKVEGDLTVEARTGVIVTITGKTATVTYNGKEQSVTGYTVQIGDQLYDESFIKFSGDSTAKGTNAGTYVAGLTPDMFSNSSANFADVQFVVTDAVLTIERKDVTLTSKSAEKAYDGTPLTAEEVTAEGFVDGEGVDCSDFAVLEGTGSTENTFTYTVKDGTLADNYNITVKNGTLTVTANANITVTGYEGVYDGKAHDCVIDLQIGNTPADTKWEYTYSLDGEHYTEEMPVITHAGEVKVYVRATSEFGEVLDTTVIAKVTPATIRVTPDAKTKVEGEDDPAFTFTYDGNMEGEIPGFSGKLEREEGEGRGTYPINGGTLDLINGENFLASDYELVVDTDSLLTILHPELKIEVTVDKKEADVGEIITYTVTVTNIGEVDLENIRLTDTNIGVDELIAKLAIGESVTFTYTYIVKPEDEGKTLEDTFTATTEGGSSVSQKTEVVIKVVPKMGDPYSVTLWYVMIGISIAAISVAAWKKERYEA